MSTKTATKPPPRMDRAPRTLAVFECAVCQHTGIGRLDALTGLTCFACGSVGTARELPAIPRRG